jgi:hypothetical protein
MQGFHIWSIAKYEIKTLTRSWFFRIFGIIAIAVLFFYNLALQGDFGPNLRWGITVLPAGIPYSSLLILNVAQAIIAAFLASDFLKRDRKLDSTEVIYMRSMSNGDYVIGKTIGNLIVFLALNIIVLLMVAVFNLVSKTTGIDGMAYVQYLVFLSIPTLIFIMGLSFILMSIIRNQGITFILLLGYIALVLFYLKDKFNYVFDYMGYNVPMMKSDFTGFGNFQEVLLHRGLYLFLGLGFIFWTIILLKRLPQSRFANLVSGILAFVFVSGGVLIAVMHVSNYYSIEGKKERMIALNTQYADQEMVSVTRHDILFEHSGSSYNAESRMSLHNFGSTQINEIILSLNPGLKIKSLLIDGKAGELKREMHLIRIKHSLLPGDSIECLLNYGGGIDEAACYLEMTNESRQSLSEYYQNSFSFVKNNYVLLTPETNWYPTAGVGFSDTNPRWMKRDFIKFSLSLKDPFPLQAISQGEVNTQDDKIIFTPEQALPFITLIIGDYKTISSQPDSIDFQLAFHPEHDFFSEHFPDIKDTIPALLSANLQDFERRVNLKYPYKRIFLVEVPVQFSTFQHIWAGGYENVQPEIILVPEMGIGIRQANIRGTKRFASRFNRGDQAPSEKDKQLMAFNNFLNVFFNEQPRTPFNVNFGNSAAAVGPNRYYIFPQFFNYTNYITSPELPIFNRVLEAYLKNTFSDMRSIMMRQVTGITQNEKANMALQEKSFAELLNDPGSEAIINNVIQLKGDVLFSNINAQIGKETFEDFLYHYLENYKYTSTELKSFEKELSERFQINFSSFIDEWMNSSALPGYVFGPIKAENVRSERMIQTMVQFTVSNMEAASGMIKVVFRLGGGGRGGFGGGFMGGGGSENVIEKYIYLEGKQTKEISYLLDGTPRAMTLNTMTSKNIPSEIVHPFRRMELNRRRLPFEGERILSESVSLDLPGEIIVDNEDPGFELIQPENAGLFFRLMGKNMEDEELYSGMDGRRSPENWRLTTSSNFYGKYVRSAYFVRQGVGDRKARWNVPISETGYYDVYFYREFQLMPQMRGPGGGRPEGRTGGQDGAGPQEEDQGEYYFIIHHDDGEETIVVNMNDIEGGWNRIGTYPFSNEKAVIELTNQGNGPRKIADAVKLIKEQN